MNARPLRAFEEIAVAETQEEFMVLTVANMGMDMASTTQARPDGSAVDTTPPSTPPRQTMQAAIAEFVTEKNIVMTVADMEMDMASTSKSKAPPSSLAGFYF